jgi:hypothetical protein
MKFKRALQGEHMIMFPSTNSDHNKDNLLFDIIFTIIVILAASFSAFTTYLGFSYDLPKFASGVIATIIGLGLFIINMTIKRYQQEGQNIAKPIMAFLFFLIFSFISNTNAIYTYFLQKDIVQQTQIKAEKNFDKGTSIILAALENDNLSVNVSRIKQELDIAKRNLYNQMVDPANPGLGSKAKEHLSEVETILGVQLTKLKPPSPRASLQKHKNFANHLMKLIDEQFKTKYVSGKAEEIEAFKRDIEHRKVLYRTSIIKKEFNRDITDAMARDLESIKVKAEKLVGFRGDIPTIDTSADDIGSFNYTWSNFVNGVNKSAIMLSVLLSLMLDTLAPVLAVLLYRKKEEYID